MQIYYSKKSQGFTLLNLLSALTIIAILLGFGIPAFSTLIDSVRKREATSKIMHMLSFARESAVYHSAPVVICPSVSMTACDRDWNQDLMVFIDSNDNQDWDKDERILQIFSKRDKNQTLSWRSFGKKNYLSYDAQGTSGFQSGRIYYCDKNAGEAHKRVQIIVYRTGRSRIARGKELRKRC